MPDQLDAEIERAKADYATAEGAFSAARRVRDLAKATLEALELAAKLRPVTPTRLGAILRTNGPVSANRGRQPGAISKQWRAILMHLAQHYPTGFTEEQVIQAAKEHGLLNIRPKDARDRMGEYRGHSYIDHNEITGLFTVTYEAKTRFGDPSAHLEEGEEEETAHQIVPAATQD
jgi:hypothetical protein